MFNRKTLNTTVARYNSRISWKKSTFLPLFIFLCLPFVVLNSVSQQISLLSPDAELVLHPSLVSWPAWPGISSAGSSCRRYAAAHSRLDIGQQSAEEACTSQVHTTLFPLNPSFGFSNSTTCGGFSPGTPVFPSPQKPTFLNSNSIWTSGT